MESALAGAPLITRDGRPVTEFGVSGGKCAISEYSAKVRANFAKCYYGKSPFMHYFNERGESENWFVLDDQSDLFMREDTDETI